MSELPAFQETQKRALELNVEAWAAKNMRKEARVSLPGRSDAAWDIACDEGEWLGGDNTAPPPLAYFSSSIAF